jgi:hypothetical protein
MEVATADNSWYVLCNSKTLRLSVMRT